MKSIFKKTLILFIISSQSYALDINNSIKSTIENNYKVKLAYEKLEESKELIKYAAGSNQPSVTGTIEGKYSNSDTSTTTSTTTPETITDTYKVIISKNIYDSGLNNLEINRSKILFENEMINFESTIQNLILDAINGYLSVVNFSKSLEANKKNYDSFSKVLEETKTRFNLGSATLYELQKAEASFSSSETNLFIAEQNLNISKKTFKRIVGLNPIDLNEVININENIDLQDILKNALENNLEIIKLSNNIREKQILILKEKKSNKPSLDLKGTGQYSNGSRLDQGTENTNASLSLTLTIPLYQKGQDNSNIRKYNSQMLQSELELEDVKENIQILIENTFKDFKINESMMKSNLIIIQSIETSLDSLKAEYDIGTKTISDLIDEEENLLNSKVNYLNSKKDYILNYFKLKSLDRSLIKLFNEYLPQVN